MSKKTDIQMKVDAAMDSLSGMGRTLPQPFFYTRVRARLDNKQRTLWDDISRVITRPAFAFLSLSLVVLLNTFVIFSESSTQTTSESQEFAVADEYNRTSSYYDLENVIP